MLNVKINQQQQENNIQQSNNTNNNNNSLHNNYINYNNTNQTGIYQQSPISSLSSLVFGKPPAVALKPTSAAAITTTTADSVPLSETKFQLQPQQPKSQQHHYQSSCPPYAISKPIQPLIEGHQHQLHITHNNPQIICQKIGQKNVFTCEFDINDVPIFARNILTKGQTHDEIAQYSGASISTRGRYISPVEKSKGGLQTRSLYLFVQGPEQESVALTIRKINEIILNDQNINSNSSTSTEIRMTKYNSNNNNRQPTPSASGYNMAPQPNNNQPSANPLQQQQQPTFIEKMLIGLDHAPQAFNLREQIIGAGGANLQYIRNETGAIATLRGRGSLFIDSTLGGESPESLYLYIEHQRFEGLQSAKQLAKNLIETLQQELMHFQQLNSNLNFNNGNTILQKQQQQLRPPVQQPQITAQINIPPPSLLAIPPPNVSHQSNHQIDPATALVHQNFLQQNHQLPPVQSTLSIPPPSQPLPTQHAPTIIHQQIMPQTTVQLQHGNMVIQQQNAAIGNVNIPPPNISIPIKTGQLIQFQQQQQQQQPPVIAQQQPATISAQLTHPPPNIQIQQPGQTQILLNHPQHQQYQYQYIQQPVQATADGHQLQQNQQVTIQHIYQPHQQQLQNIQVQQTATALPQTQPSNCFDSQYQQIRTAPQYHTTVATAPGQPQYITVQGSTAYMVPPPTIIHQQIATQSQQITTASNQNIIFQQPSQQQQHLQQVQMQLQQNAIALQNVPQAQVQAQHLHQQLQPATSSQEQQNEDVRTSSLITDEKDEIKSENEDEGSSPARKTDDDSKSDNENQSNDESSEAMSAAIASSNNQNHSVATTSTNSPSIVQQQEFQQIRHQQLPSTQIPPPAPAIVANVQPPISCVQHFVGNTLITGQPNVQTHTNQIYTQVPVSIQQIQHQIHQGQQCVVSTANGQHFVVSAAPQQWQQATTQQLTQHVQQIQSNGTIQNVQITHQQIAGQPAEFRTLPPPQQSTQLTVPVSTSSLAQQQQQITGPVSSGQSGQQQMTVAFNQQHLQVQLQPQILQQLPQQQQQQPQRQQIIDQTQLIGQQIGMPQQNQLMQQQQPQQNQLMQQQQPQQQQQQQFNIIRPPPTTLDNFGIAPVLTLNEQHNSQMIGQKRKFNDDETGVSNHQPRLGMGPRDQIQQQQQQHQQHRIQTQLMGLTSQPPPPPPLPQTLNSAAGIQPGGPNIIGQDELIGQKLRSGDSQQQSASSLVDQRQFYQQQQRDDAYNMDGVPTNTRIQQQQQQRKLMVGNSNRGPRFHSITGGNNGGTSGYHPMRSAYNNSMQQQQLDCSNTASGNNNNNNYQMNRINFSHSGINLPPQLQQQHLRSQQQQQYRGDCPPNINAGNSNNNNYGPGPPPSRFRGQW